MSDPVSRLRSIEGIEAYLFDSCAMSLDVSSNWPDVPLLVSQRLPRIRLSTSCWNVNDLKIEVQQ